METLTEVIEGECTEEWFAQAPYGVTFAVYTINGVSCEGFFQTKLYLKGKFVRMTVKRHEFKNVFNITGQIATIENYCGKTEAMLEKGNKQ